MNILEKIQRLFSKLNAARVPLILSVILAAVGSFFFASYYFKREWLLLEMSQASSSNIAFFIVINLNVILVMILGFLVIKNLIRLVLDRRKNILGAKLRTRLVLAFVGLSLVPTILLFLVAKGMLQRGFNEWFSPQIQVSTESALTLAKLYYNSFEEDLKAKSEYFREHIESLSTLLVSTHNQGLQDFVGLVSKNEVLYSEFLKEKLKEYNIDQAGLVDAQGHYAILVSSEDHVILTPEVNISAVYTALDGNSVVRPEQSLDAEFLRSYIPIGNSNRYSTLSGVMKSELLPADLVLVTTVRVSEELSKSLGEVINAFDDFRELKSYRRPLASSYLLTLVVVTLLIVFGAIWVGFYLARELSIPIGLLADGTQQLAAGNLLHRIPETGDDELSVLVRSFNKMTQDLSDTTGELLERRNYIETLLESVGVGVISVDDKNVISTCNPAAKLLLGIDFPAANLNTIDDLPEPLNAKLKQMLAGLNQDLYSTSGEVVLSSGNRNLHLTLTRLSGSDSRSLGAVILLDDLTELVSVQRMAAWQEVARRIAHEIKNPLTPIRLSAERIQRKFGNSQGSVASVIGLGEREIISEAMDTIVAQVEGLRNLVNEFSQFARMPKAKLRLADLNTLVSNTVALYNENFPDINFLLSIDSNLPNFPLDPEQISRVLVNLLENAITATRKVNLAEPSSSTQKAFRSVTNLLVPAFSKLHKAKIEIRTEYDPDLGIAKLIVVDSGIGIREKDKKKLFEPYFSFTEGGTGLGLAIVHNIITDHSGFIRVKDNEPRGAIFQVELPITELMQLRKLA